MPRARTQAKSKQENLSFEAILDKLEQVVEQLEQGDAPLEKALEVFEPINKNRFFDQPS